MKIRPIPAAMSVFGLVEVADPAQQEARGHRTTNGTGDGSKAASGKGGEHSTVPRLLSHERRTGSGRGRRRRPARRRLPAGRVHRPGLLSGRPARQAGARRGPAGVGKTELAKALVALPRPRARAPAVLRGARRGQGAVRVELPQAAAAHPGRGQGTGWDDGAGRHLRRGVPARAAADDRDRVARAGRAADRRDRQDRPGVRGDAARAAVATSRSRSPSSAGSRRARCRSCC